MFDVPSFDPTLNLTHTTGRFPRVRRIFRYVVASALTAGANGLVAFALVAGILLAVKLFR